MSSSVGIADHYGVLEVEREAADATVKKAYRRLVLLWHPDKHQENRDVAEEQIRRINDAYETLGNPFKRGQYDQMLLALERQARGFRLDTTTIKPRMSIPKEFMLTPVGHPSKFVRTVGTSLFGQARADAKMEFYDFFQDAKFSLWWLPEVNNMCRLRPTSSAGVGQDGGLNINFALHRTVQISEVNLSPGAMPESANVIAVASPVFQGAFRFEAAQFPGHYLAFKPPTHLRMVGGVVDEKTAIDFMLVDYAKMFNFITAEEVLHPAVVGLGGMKEYVTLASVRGDSNVNLYFRNVLKKEVWGDDDFEYFFSSRSQEWDFDVENLRVRIRSKHEQLSNSLRRSRNIGEIAAAISASSESDRLPLETLEAVLVALGQPLPPGADVTYIVNISDSQKKVIHALPIACEDIPFERLLAVSGKVAAFGGEAPESKIAKWKDEAAQEFGHLFSDRIRNDSIRDVTLPTLTNIAQMPLPWRKCGDKLVKLALPLLEDEPLEKTLPMLSAAVKALPSSTSAAEKFASHARSQLKKASSVAVAEALDAMVTGGLCLDAVPRDLERVLGEAPFVAVATVIAGLGERGIDGESLRACASFLGKQRSELEALSQAVLLRLAVAATKSKDIADKALSAVASAVAFTLPAWTVDDASKILLAVAKAKSGKGSEGVTSLFTRASEVLGLKVKECSSAQLIKVVLAIGKEPDCRPLLIAAALELTSDRLKDLPTQQLMLVTQGLLPLEEGHAAINLLLNRWTGMLNETTKAEDLLSESMGLEMVRDRRVDLEGKGQLTADQLAKLAQMLVPVAGDHLLFWKALAARFIGWGSAEGVATDITTAGKAALESAFPETGGRKLEFEGKSKMLHRVVGRKLPREEYERMKREEKELRDEKRRAEEEKEKEERDLLRAGRERDKAALGLLRADKEALGLLREDKDKEKDRKKHKGKDREKEDGKEEKGREKEEGKKDTNGDLEKAGGKRKKKQDGGDDEKGVDAVNGKEEGKPKKKKQKQKKSAQEIEEVGEEDGVLSSGSSSSSSSSSDDSSSDTSTEEEEEGKKFGGAAAGKKKKLAKAKKKQKVAGAKAKPASAEEQEKRRLLRERRGKLKEETTKLRAVAVQEKRQKHRENLEKLKAEKAALEAKQKKDAEAEAAKRRMQRERRKGRPGAEAAVVELGEEEIVELGEEDIVELGEDEKLVELD